MSDSNDKGKGKGKAPQRPEQGEEANASNNQGKQYHQNASENNT